MIGRALRLLQVVGNSITSTNYRHLSRKAINISQKVTTQYPTYAVHELRRQLLANQVQLITSNPIQVSDAIRDGRPVVALESTIVTHGMPYPHNLEMALKVEKIIEEEGAVPATVALLGGRPHVGLDSKQLEHLATSQNTVKVSRRDMAYVMANEMDGGTTVSGNYAKFIIPGFFALSNK